MIVLNAQRIIQQLGPQLAQSLQLDVQTTIPSTQDTARAWVTNKPIAVVVCEQQTAGKGQRGRSWSSPFGENVYCSYRFIWPYKHKTLAGLSLVVGLAIIATLEKITAIDLQLKWPNDVYHQDKKLAGVLVEVMTQASTDQQVIIGMGINVNMLAAEKSAITQPWVSLRQITGQNFDRNKIIANLITTLTQYLHQFKTHGLNIFLTDWQRYDYLMGKTITLVNGEEKTTGVAAGINEHGHLVLVVNGTKKIFATGSILPLRVNGGSGLF